ncbi:Carboxylesterase, type B domain and von Willebrand factor, type A domain-containing protein [Strongyloides ratti]|uniref:Carboxylesterase, type B domain and von Willebrand factor, type A domain-containing protein n=1 Tax=Strongyloides ratti TaxID=34506 RepID=A0A090KTR4_STRRB|nr:Carboxylesterase, type B domain and von Willebrand factor, type A domain-containing protein [Strongyloides ratti]CEF60796.1 Carboxylesterase, type B domain and von Willebrand factor, type A domain-containing protein [Strongyloides ratti]
MIYRTIIGTHVDLGNNKSEKFFGKADTFFAVPFVHPPINDLRLKHSIPINKFPNNPQIAQKQPSMCPQTLKSDNLTVSDGESEDCLYINIFSPNVNALKKYPVFVLIPGGGFNSGSIKEWGYKGFITNFVNNDIVVVVVQYRLGIHGFFTTFTDEIPPNRGVYDQTNALKFVKNYISEFGGDPNMITLAGHSTGAVSVTAQSLSPLANNLFDKLIIMSADINLQFSGNMPLLNIDANYEIAADLCNVTKYEWDNYPMDYINNCIKNTSIQKFIDYQKWKGYSFVLYIDKDFIGFLPDIPTNLYKNVPLKPTVLGSVDQEVGRGLLDLFNFVKLYLNKSGYEMVLMLISQLFTNDNNDQFAKLLYNFNVPFQTNDTDLYEWTKIVVDTAGGLGIYNFLALHSINLLNNGNNNIYMYENSYVYNYCPKQIINGKTYNPLSHADDFFALTMRPEFFDSQNNSIVTVDDINMAHKLGTYWSIFVKNATSLNGFSNPWKSITSSNNLKYLNIKTLNNDQILDNYHKKDYQLYENSLSVVLDQWPFEDSLSRNNNGRKYPKSTTSTSSTKNILTTTIQPTGNLYDHYQPCNSSIVFSIASSQNFVPEVAFQKQIKILSGNDIIQTYWNHFERISVISYNSYPNIVINFNSVTNKNDFNKNLLNNIERDNEGNNILKLFKLISSNNFLNNTTGYINHFIFVTVTDYMDLRQSQQYSTIIKNQGSLNFIILGDEASTFDLSILNPDGIYQMSFGYSDFSAYLGLSNFVLSSIRC